MINRRAVLRAAGWTGAAGLTGGTVAGCTAAPPPTSPATPTASPPAGPPDWNALRTRLPGGLVLPAEDGFDAAKHVYNPEYDGRTPAAVARCTTPADVQACVEAAARRLPIAARAGGHSYAGYSVPDGGLVIDVRPMAAISVQGSTATIGAGALLRDVHVVLAAAGRCLPTGTCPTVGIAGQTLGGGIGVLTRNFGLTCDHLTAARIVTADGTLRTASAESEPELFWALRGGGGGNFGVVTSFTFDTPPAPDLTVFSMRFAADVVDELLGNWQRWIVHAPDELWSKLVLTGGSPVTAQVGGCFVGGADALDAVLDDLLRRGNTPPTTRWTAPLGYLAAMEHFAGGADRRSFAASSRIVQAPIADAAGVVALMTGRTGVDLLIDGLGGAVTGTEPTDSAFWHRTAIASVQVYASPTAGTHAAATRSVAEVINGLAGLGIEGGYVNYIDPALPDWLDAYYGDNVGRLRRVASAYDPDGVFGFAQGITPA